MKVVLLEDDPQLLRHLQKTLTVQGWQVTDIRTIQELQTLIETKEDFDLFILDRLVGKQDSVQFLGNIKNRWPHSKTLILSSIDLPEEKAKWLMQGADEYMGKPVFSDELIARINLLVKRGTDSNPSLIKIGNLAVDKFRHHVKSGVAKLDLTAKEYALLLLLAEYPGRVYNKIQILENIWDIKSEAETNVVESTVNNLRRKLEDCGASIEIKSKRNFGYWIEI